MREGVGERERESHEFRNFVRVSRGGRPGLPVPNSLYGLCGRKATFEKRRDREREREGGWGGGGSWSEKEKESSSGKRARRALQKR